MPREVADPTRTDYGRPYNRVVSTIRRHSRILEITNRGLCCKRGSGRFWYGVAVTRRRPVLVRGRHFEDVIIVLRVRWYLDIP
jgi:hypothetical protein